MSLTAQVATEPDADGQSGMSSEIIVDGTYRIVPGSPLSELDRPGAPAYAARDRRNPGRQLFANVCDPGVLPRVGTLVQLKTLREASVIRPVAWDPVEWPRARQRCFAVVYEHPEETPIIKSLRDRVPAHSTEFLVGSVLGPLSLTLALMSRRSQAHRAISPDNMYRLGDSGEAVLLGDCVTSPPGWAQRALMEPIEVGMTPRESRGNGGFADDIEQWIGGVLRRSVQPSRELRSNRSFEFEGAEHRNCRTLAQAFGCNPVETAKVIRSKDFDSWLVRGVSDPALVEQIGEIMMYTGSKNKDAEESVIISRICVALDPLGPLRYKGMIADPQGLGTTLAAAMEADDNARVQLISDCIAKGLPSDWLKQRALNLPGDYANLDKEFRRLQQLFKHNGPGYGMERALYEMNPFVPCKSELLKSSYVYSLRDLLPALEQIVHDNGELPLVIDRHIAAFIAARLKGPTEQILTIIEDRDDTLNSKLAMVKLLGAVQKDYGPEALPNLTGWLSEELLPTIDQFQSQSIRDELKQKMPSVVARGQLSVLHDHLNSKQLIKRDQMAKTQAAREFADAAAKIERLISKKFQDDALRTGWSIAAGGSMMLSIVTIAILMVW